MRGTWRVGARAARRSTRIRGRKHAHRGAQARGRKHGLQGAQARGRKHGHQGAQARGRKHGHQGAQARGRKHGLQGAQGRGWPYVASSDQGAGRRKGCGGRCGWGAQGVSRSQSREPSRPTAPNGLCGQTRAWDAHPEGASSDALSVSEVLFLFAFWLLRFPTSRYLHSAEHRNLKLTDEVNRRFIRWTFSFRRNVGVAPG